MRDIRIYHYSGSSSLEKFGRNKAEHQHTSADAAIQYLDNYVNKHLPKHRELFRRKGQYVLIEYTDKYQSEIIKIINYLKDEV